MRRGGAPAALVLVVLGTLHMGIGRSGKQGRFDDAAVVLGDRLAPGSLYRLLADEGHRLFADGYFRGLVCADASGAPDDPGAGGRDGDAVGSPMRGSATGRPLTGSSLICAGRLRLG